MGGLRVILQKDSGESLKAFDGKKDTVLLEVLEYDNNSINCRVISSKIGVPERRNIRLYYDGDALEFVSGDQINAEIKYKYKYSSSLAAEGIFLTASGEIKDVYPGSGVFYLIRKSVVENSEVLFGEFDSAPAISKGVTIGDRSDIDSYIFTIYKSGGISHVLAISGLHISIFVFSVFNFVRAVTGSYKLGGVLSSLTAVAYTVLVGFNAGAVRSAIMVIFLMLSRLFMRHADSFTTIFISLFVLTIVNPYAICSAGLQLSFLSSIGILLVEQLTNDIDLYFSLNLRRGFFKRLLYKLTTIIISPVIISFVASVFSFPVLCISFDTISYISPIINIIAVPFYSFAITLSIVAFFVAPISMTVAKLIAYPAGFAFDTVTDLVKWVHNADIGVMSVHLRFMIIPLVLSILMIASLVFLGRKRYLWFSAFAVSFCVSLLFCNLYNNYSNRDKVLVVYENTDCEYVYSTYGGGVYVDLGGYTSSPEVIYESGYTALDYYIIADYTSYSAKHYDYLSGSLHIENIYLPKPKNATDVLQFSEIKELANQRNCDIIIFDEYCTGLSGVSVFGSDDDISKETLVCIDIKDIKIRYIDNGFNNAVSCDVAVLLDDAASDNDNIMAKAVYATGKFHEENSEADNSDTFQNTIVVEIDLQESEYKVYEP